ncbi:hypothetical protein PF007_g31257 [Phytophthora fragariae]|uniref:SET domain-containing protein n=1 Tax=Phytophthora fragariae TaxID=53985 RepID=A0A6A3PPH1_9STRA|nr:hypothetical protein PF007_g31257 [Phytophthora fragariae]
MDRFLVGGEAAANYRRDRWTARPWVEERSVLQDLTEYEVIDQNKFCCRPKQVHEDDEIPHCKCRRGQDWTLTCGIGCENRSMQVECVSGKCVTGGRCSNQQMQDDRNALLSVKNLSHKGMSLFASEQILPGAFVCQYTGEIIRSSTYRRREMELNGVTNYYGMAINNNEVIDARAFGGIARFANHSCQPNCVVERWDVNGEICCGFFAKTLIENNEEITIDYGGGNTTATRRKKCMCKKAGCRGLIPM